MSEEESDELFERWAIPSPGKPLFEAAAANFSLHSPAKVDTENDDRGPLLLIMGGKDHTVPEVDHQVDAEAVPALHRHHRPEEFDRGHSLTIDTGWREVADACLVWLTKYDL